MRGVKWYIVTVSDTVWFSKNKALFLSIQWLSIVLAVRVLCLRLENEEYSHALSRNEVNFTILLGKIALGPPRHIEHVKEPLDCTKQSFQVSIPVIYTDVSAIPRSWDNPNSNPISTHLHWNRIWSDMVSMTGMRLCEIHVGSNSETMLCANRWRV